jgi:hypothetical protein
MYQPIERRNLSQEEGLNILNQEANTQCGSGTQQTALLPQTHLNEQEMISARTPERWWLRKRLAKG